MNYMYALIYFAAFFQAGIGTGRTIPSVAALLGLIGVVIAGLAFIRPGFRRMGVPLGIVLALVSLLVGGLHAAYAAGGVGTGNGLAGAFVAVALGLIGVILGGLALVRSRQSV